MLTLIDSGRWRSALFTTFTLSLTYFESHVLPRLRKQGCQKLTIVVDKAGYRDSLMEQRARAVGRDYSVVPVSVTGSGIFHPKLVHLRALEGDDDLLLVGSGNLTYSGHGGNVEVLEVLRPAAHATGFRQAAAFFERLGNNPKVSVADTNALLLAAERLLDVSSRGDDTEAVRFIDSLESSGADQLLAQARAVAPTWDELVVLSPYHHPQAEPVQAVLKALGVKHLVIGVSTKAEGSAFPFEIASGFGLTSLTAQKPLAEKGERRALHAKWFELRRPGSALVLTGSFNATNESFAATNNVECGVLRLLSGSSADLWEAATIPPYSRGEFPVRDGGADICLFASLDSSSRLVGKFVGGADCEGVWEVLLQNVEEILAEDQVEVSESGAFTWPVPCSVDEVTSATLQVTLTHNDGRRARGWVQVSRVLNMRLSERVLLQSLANLANSTHTEDGANAVLDYVLQEFGNLMGSPNPARPPTTHSDGKPPAMTPAPTKGLTASEFNALKDPWGVPNQYDGGMLLGALDGGLHGWDLLKHICAALMVRAPAGKSGPPTGPPEQANPPPWSGFGGGGPALPEDPDDKTHPQMLAQLDKVHEALEKQLSAAEVKLLVAQTPEVRAAVEVGRSRMLLMASWVELRFRLLEMGEVETAHHYVWQWLKKTCDLQLEAEQKQHLDGQVCGVAAACALWLLESVWFPNDYGHAPKQVHRLLNRYFAGKVNADAVVNRARKWLQEPAGLMLTQGRVDDALMALLEVMAEPTELQVLAGILRDGLEAHRSLATKVFDAAHLKALEGFLKGHSPARPRYSLVEPRLLAGCPRCNTALTWVRQGDGYREPLPELTWQLRLFGFVKCPREDYFLVNREAA